MTDPDLHDSKTSDSPPHGPRTGDDEDRDPGDVGLWSKLVLTAFPFAVIFLFLLLEWWIRGRS